MFKTGDFAFDCIELQRHEDGADPREYDRCLYHRHASGAACPPRKVSRRKRVAGVQAEEEHAAKELRVQHVSEE